MKNSHAAKSGAALVIALGFLAILTIMILMFATQTRTERLSGRAYLTSAQTRHLLHTALARAMEDIDSTVGTNYPGFFALGSTGDTGLFIADSVGFGMEQDYFQFDNTAIQTEYRTERDSAQWETIADASGTAVGRMGYIIVNSSGLLDANAVGGLDRNAGASPKEIQLDPDILPDLETSSELVLSDGSKVPADSPAHAFAHNRDNAWRRYESLRDLYQLNRGQRGHVINGTPVSFSTFSYRPGDDMRTFMGTNSTTLDEELIREQLEKIDAVDSDYVMNQLHDYLDTDTVPVDVDRSVEPVPLINELALICNFQFSPQIEENEEGTMEVTSVVISNSYSLDMEVWYPFTGYENGDAFTVHIADPPVENGGIQLPTDLFGDILDWTDDHDIPVDVATPGSTPYDYTVHEAQYETEVATVKELESLFEKMQTDIQFPSIFCDNAAGAMVDRVLNLELPLETAVADELLPVIRTLSSNLFNAATAVDVSNRFVVAMACVDPRLNWDGESIDQWKEDADAGENASAGTLGEINTDAIGSATTPDDTDEPRIFVRNTDRIDTPWEFTYFLYDTSNPWKTFQMLEEYDDDDTRFVMQNLSPYPRGKRPRQGLLNPYSPHTNVISSVFMDMPVDEFNIPDFQRLEPQAAKDAAALFMKHVAEHGWRTNAAEYGTGIDLVELEKVVGDGNPWVLESYFRNTFELFNKRDTLYTLLLAAQGGTDADGDGSISDDEVRGTQKAVVYVWRDPQTGKAACVFHGLSDTLESSIRSDGQTWGTILQAFNPDS